jgi:phage regulator Rha-like protein
MQCEDLGDMFQVLESNNQVYTLSRKIIELAEKQKIITNAMIR